MMRINLLPIAIGLLIRNWWLVLPIPSPPSQVQKISDAIAPKPASTITYTPNDDLQQRGVKLFQGKIFGSESVCVHDNTMYMLDRYGWLYSAPSDSDTNSTSLQRLFYFGPGRPLGYHIHPKTGKLIICDSLKGLTEADVKTGKLSVLANIADNQPINYANDLDISSSDGSIYFSDSTFIPPAINRLGFYDTMASYLLSLCSGRPTGRLLKYNPADGSVQTLVSGIWFANGVALAQDESFVLVVETSSRRLRKHYLKGSKAGTTELFMEGLPGYPDGLTRSADGNFWIAIILPDSPIQNTIMKLGPWAQWLASWALKVTALPVKKWGMVMKVTPNGDIVEILMDPQGEHIAGVSGVFEDGNRLYMGHLSGNYVSYINL